MADPVDLASLDRMVRVQPRQRSRLQQLSHDRCSYYVPCRGFFISLDNVLPLSDDQEDAGLDLCYQRRTYGLLFGGGSAALQQLGIEALGIGAVMATVFILSYVSVRIISKAMHGILNREEL